VLVFVTGDMAAMVCCRSPEEAALWWDLGISTRSELVFSRRGKFAGKSDTAVVAAGTVAICAGLADGTGTGTGATAAITDASSE